MKDRKYSIKTNLYEILKEYETGIISSDVLGKAFEPEQCFENPNGTAIIFDQDYFGGHRGIKQCQDPLLMQPAQKRLYGSIIKSFLF